MSCPHCQCSLCAAERQRWTQPFVPITFTPYYPNTNPYGADAMRCVICGTSFTGTHVCGGDERDSYDPR
jgi:hypothetical protein